MKTTGQRIAAGLANIVMIAALSACQKAEGPAEHAGKEIDKAADNAGQQIEKAGERIQDTAKGDRK